MLSTMYISLICIPYLTLSIGKGMPQQYFMVYRDVREVAVNFLIRIAAVLHNLTSRI
jgi:hypothetical protein